MPYIDKMKVKNIRALIRARNVGFSSHEWFSHGWDYILIKRGDVWWIEAGCRCWDSFGAMRKHYKPEWVHDRMRRAGGSRAKTEEIRKESLAIATKMRRFATKYRIRLAGERFQKRRAS